jgi:hypothetical protein
VPVARGALPAWPAARHPGRGAGTLVQPRSGHQDAQQEGAVDCPAASVAAITSQPGTVTGSLQQEVPRVGSIEAPDDLVSVAMPQTLS